jgi:two-component system sensor histidine kinase PilS (NtrC family)
MAGEHALTVRIKALISFRAVFVTLLLGSAFLLRVDYFYARPRAISYYIIFLYSLTIIYSLLFGRMRNLLLFAYVQLVGDVLSEMALIYITGGVESPFSFVLILSVMASSIVLNKKAGYVIASLSSILYGVLLDLQFYNLLPIPHEFVTYEREFLYNIFIHILALYLTAYLSGYLSYRLEETVEKLQERDVHLKDLEYFNVKVIESLPSGLFTTDMTGDVLIFNRAAERITGKQREAVIGRKIETALPFLSFPFREGRFEGVLECDGNMQKVIGINITVLEDLSGNETGRIGVFQDLTQLKTLEMEVKQKEKWAAIGELSANIAHEIRNPIASMRGSIEMLIEDKIPAKHREKLMEIALKEMERVNNIITDFLTYSSPRPLEMQKVDVHLLLDETLSLLRNRVQENGTVRIAKEFDGPLFLVADPQKIRQVFWNLGLNSIEAMGQKGELTVSTKDSRGTVQIVFADSGPGIDPAKIDKIFYPFFTTKERGTGLGLSIAYRIIEEHKGKLKVRSEPGINTTFEIILRKNNGAS